jgi:4-amino-4-deoxy-L-arabinose transferase-like glycosyltransferase
MPLLFLILIILAALLRLLNLGHIPPGLYLDEVLYGLDAYSLLKTGKDIYGHFLPLALQSSGYYPPLFPYFLAPFFLIFPLSAITVRLPVALTGIASVIIIYFLAQILVDKSDKRTPLLAAFFLGFSPWHLHMSRVAFLNSFGIIFPLLATYLFVKAVANKSLKPSFLIISTIFLALSSHVHYGYKFFSPLLFVVLVALWWKKIKTHKKTLILLSLIWLITLATNWYSSRAYNALFRAQQLSGTSVKTIVSSYLQAYSFSFLFHPGDKGLLANPWARGQLPFSLLPLLIIGLFSLPRLKKSSRLIILTWLLAIPLPSALAGSGTHAVRLSPLLIPLSLISALGLTKLSQSFKKPSQQNLITVLVASLFLLESLTYLRSYKQKCSDISHRWGQPQRALINQALDQSRFFETIIFADSFNMMLAFYAFETKMDPIRLQQAILHPTNLNSIPAKILDNVYFIPQEEISDPNWPSHLLEGSLIIKP